MVLVVAIAKSNLPKVEVQSLKKGTFFLDSNVSEALAEFQVLRRLEECTSNDFILELFQLNILTSTKVDSKASVLW